MFFSPLLFIRRDAKLGAHEASVKKGSKEDDVEYAGFWSRAIADFLDSSLLDLVSCMVILICLGLTYWAGKIFGGTQLTEEQSFLELIPSFTIQLMLFSVRGALSLGYYTYGHYQYGTTFGKKLLKIYVVSAGSHRRLNLKQSWIRTFAYLVSYAPLGAGFLMVIFQPQKRALHDLLADSVSVFKRRKD